MKIGFTGTRSGMSDTQKTVVRNVLEALQEPSGTSFAHGDCVGADAQAHALASELGLGIFIHPPIDARLRAFCVGAVKVFQPRHYTARNRDIVQTCDVLVAAPREFHEQSYGGTWYTVRHARKTGKRILIVYPDGMVTEGE